MTLYIFVSPSLKILADAYCRHQARPSVRTLLMKTSCILFILIVEIFMAINTIIIIIIIIFIKHFYLQPLFAICSALCTVHTVWIIKYIVSC